MNHESPRKQAERLLSDRFPAGYDPALISEFAQAIAAWRNEPAKHEPPARWLNERFGG
jgi:hypothetical protein